MMGVAAAMGSLPLVGMIPAKAENTTY